MLIIEQILEEVKALRKEVQALSGKKIQEKPVSVSALAKQERVNYYTVIGWIKNEGLRAMPVGKSFRIDPADYKVWKELKKNQVQEKLQPSRKFETGREIGLRLIAERGLHKKNKKVA